MNLNPLIEAYECFLTASGVKPFVTTISIAHLVDYDIVLLLKNKNGGIGGDFTVFSGEGGYEKYNIGEFTELLFWCIKQGWKIEFETEMRNAD